MIDDSKIKELIDQYQKTEEGYDEIVIMISDFVYNYPRIKYQRNEDDCSDFYLYFFERFQNALNKYQVEDVLFVSWLMIVLKNHFINWIKKRSKEKNTISLEDMPAHINLAEKDSSNEEEIVESKKETIKEILNSLPKKVRVVMKLHYFYYFDGDDLINISHIFNKDIHQLIEKHDSILNKLLPQYEKQQALMDDINTNFAKITEYRDKLHHLSQNAKSETHINEMERLKTQITKRQNRQKNLTDQFNRFYISVPTQDMSDLLGITVNAIHNLIYRGKLILKEKLTGLEQ